MTEDDWDLSTFVSNTFTLEHPKGPGVRQVFPEVDRIEWFDMATAMLMIHPGQLGFLLEMQEVLLRDPHEAWDGSGPAAELE
jgi:predicted NUDIX family NTP pyrophosphohydrolase